MRSFFCCKLRALVLGIAVVFFAVQGAILAATLFLAVTDVGEKVGMAVDWLEARANEAKDYEAAADFRDVRSTLVRRSYDFIAIPVTACIVLMLSDALLLWSAASKQHRVLLWPWLVLHAIEWAAAAAALVFSVVIVPKQYMKVLLFLVVCPFLVVFAFCWFVVKCFFNYLRDLSLKEAVAAVYHSHHNHHPKSSSVLPATVYNTGEEVWDHPLPIWASASSQSSNTAWGTADYLQHPDPRHGYVPPPSSLQLPGGGGPSLPSYYRSPGPRSVASSNYRNRLNPTRLPDGTLVVPLADENDTDDDVNLSEIEEEVVGNGVAGRHRYHAAAPASGRRYKKRSGGLSGGGARSSRSSTAAAAPMSDDGTTASVMSLSDKYRQQEEMEVFEEFYPVPVTSPTRTEEFGGGFDKPESNKGSSSAAAIPINSTRAAAAAGRKHKAWAAGAGGNRGMDSPRTQSTVT